MIHDVMQSNAVYHYPIWAVGLLMCAGAVGASVVLQLAVARLVRADLRRHHNVATGWMISVVGVTYAVLLAFVAMLAWQTYDAAEAATSREGARLVDAAQLADGLAEPGRSQLRGALVAYAKAVCDIEWPAQAEGRRSLAGDAPLRSADALVAALHPQDLGQGNMQAALLAALARLREARGNRLAAATTTIPGIVWIVVVAGGALTLAMTCLLGAWSLPMHLLLGALVALSGTLILVMIVALSHPFRGDFRVTTRPFGVVLEEIGRD